MTTYETVGEFGPELTPVLREWFRRCDEIGDLARLCKMQDDMIGRATLVMICLLIDRDHEEDPRSSSSQNIARAFLHTQGFRVATVQNFDIAMHRSGCLSSRSDGLYTCITLRELIAQFHGESFMHDEYVRLFGPIYDDEYDDEYDDVTEDAPSGPR
jgi:hypothetical protein